MGFTVQDFKTGYITAPVAYVCLSERAVELARWNGFGATTYKYRLTCNFAIYFSKSERDNGAQPIERKSYHESLNVIPADLTLWAYDKAKNDFQVFEDNI